MNINEWAEDDRPRERLMKYGAETLSTAELLAILIGSGNREETAVELMRRLMVDCDDSLQTLSRRRLDELTDGKYKGLGQAKAVTIMAACELGRRRAYETAVAVRMDNSEKIAAYFRPMLQDLPSEECHVMLLSQNFAFQGTRLISKGGITSSVVDVRRVLHEALVGNAPCIALCHNHPSGSLKPSQADKDVTARLKESCQVMDIRLIDHIIVSNSGYYSFNDSDMM